MTTRTIKISAWSRDKLDAKKYSKLLEGYKEVKEYGTWYGKYVVIMKKEIKNG